MSEGMPFVTETSDDDSVFANNGKSESSGKFICEACNKEVRTARGLNLHQYYAHGGTTVGKDGERRPKARTKPRVNLTKFGTQVWHGLAWVSARGEAPAASRCFDLQSEAAGPAFEHALKGSLLDKVLQPVARLMESGSELGTLAALPLSAETFRRNPSPVTRVAFVGALEASLPHIAQSFKDARKRQEKLEDNLSVLAEAFGKEPGERVSLEEIAGWIIGGGESPASDETEQPAA